MPLTCENIHGVVGEFQRDYLYKVFFGTIPLPSASNPNMTFTSTFDVDIMNKSAVFPGRETNLEKVQWGEDYFYVPVNNAYERKSDFEFFDDERSSAYDVFNFLKDFTGTEENNASTRPVDKFDMGVAMVSVDKKTITRCRKLIGCYVYKLDYGESKKDGSSIRSLKVGIAWDRSREDYVLRRFTC